MIGQQIGHYYLIAKLGSGGMGEVYEAQDTRLPRTVAVKVLKSALSEERVALRRFKREARLASSLNHPNICTVLDVNEANGTPFIAMEFLEGQSLRERLEAGPIDLSETIDIGMEVASALGTAHDKRILHRDVTPGNIFLTQQGAAKLLDFGLAKNFRGEAATEVTDGVTAFGQAPGTVYYMAPEQLEPETGQPVDHRSDLFALGVVLYQMACGTRPFRSPVRKDVIDGICRRDPPPVSTMMPSTTSDDERDHRRRFERIVDRLMAKRVGERYQSAWALRTELDALRERIEAGRHRPASPPVAGAGAFSSVAVLPFSGDTETFSEGLADAVREALSGVDGVRVRPAARGRERDESIAEAGRRLGADVVLEGAVKRVSGPSERVRTIAFLYRAATEESMDPAVKVETQADDPLAAQAEVGRAVAGRVRTELARSGGAVAARREEESRHEYREARHHLRSLFAGGAEQAIEHARLAVQHDPTMVEAHTSLAVAYNFLGFFSLMRPRVAFQMARRAAEQALALDERSPMAHLELAMVRFGGDWNWEGAEAAFRRAIELEPDLAVAHAQYGWLLVLLGRLDAAFAEAERARELAPTSHLMLASCAQAYFLAEDYDTCRDRCQECLDLSPEGAAGLPHPFATYLLGQSLLMQGRHVEARAKLEETVALGGGAPFYLGLLGRCYGEISDQSAAAGVIETLNGQAAAGRYVAPHCYVYTYHGLGNRAAALEHQERAYEDGASPLNYLSPFVRDLFSLDPEQRDRLRQMRLTL